MSVPAVIPATLLVATSQEWASIIPALEEAGFAVVDADSGVAALGRARVAHPDAIVLSSTLPDMSGIEACRLLHADPLVGGNVPVVVLTTDAPSPAQRVAALAAGVWDFFRQPHDSRELSMKLQTYVEARRNATASTDVVDPVSGLHARSALVRRSRELGGLMTRMHGALSCLVFDTDVADPAAAALVAQVTRVSDVVGVLGPSQFAVLAPGTNANGAASLALRISAILRGGAKGEGGGVQALLVGYEAIDNLTYTPINPPDLIAKASAAVRTGRPEPANHWLRRFEPAAGFEAPRNTPASAVPAFDPRGA